MEILLTTVSHILLHPRSLLVIVDLRRPLHQYRHRHINLVSVIYISNATTTKYILFQKLLQVALGHIPRRIPPILLQSHNHPH